LFVRLPHGGSLREFSITEYHLIDKNRAVKNNNFTMDLFENLMLLSQVTANAVQNARHFAVFLPEVVQNATFFLIGYSKSQDKHRKTEFVSPP
jgi:hypothetical protein